MCQAARRHASRFVGLTLLHLLCGPALAAADTKDVIAQLGATRFMASDLRDYVRSLEPETRRQALADPRLASRLVQLEIIRKAILDEALAKKWWQKPEVAKQISAARDAIVLKSYMASAIAMAADYPSDQQIGAAYDLNRDKFLVPRQYRLAQIFIASPAGDKNADAALRKAQALASNARGKNARFEDLARQNSQHALSAAKGGDTGWLIETQILPELRAKIAGMSRGDVSDPIRTNQGWHIVRLLDTKPAAPKPLAEVRSLIISSLRQKRQEDEEQHYIVRMLQKTPVSVNDARMRTVLEAAR